MMSIQSKICIRRIVAFLIDYLIILIPSIIISVITIIQLNFSSNIGLLLFTIVFLFVKPLKVLSNMPLERAVILIIITFFSVLTVYVVYCLLLELIFGQTLGGKCSRIKYVNRKGNDLNKKEILVRNILKFLMLGCCLIGLFSVIFKRRKTMYDIISKTEVIII